jgi:ABC-type nitrate/sulfonate/bicarbonate transport system substrate-binding protein
MKLRRLLFVALLCIIPALARAAEPPAKFLFAYGAIGGNAMPLWIAKEQGIFRKYNLDPQLIFIIAGRGYDNVARYGRQTELFSQRAPDY